MIRFKTSNPELAVEVVARLHAMRFEAMVDLPREDEHDSFVSVWSEGDDRDLTPAPAIVRSVDRGAVAWPLEQDPGSPRSERVADLSKGEGRSVT